MFKDNILGIFEKCSFEELSDTNFESFILDNLPFDFCYTYFYGASKLVIAPNYEDKYVIKIPFSGYIDCAYNQFYLFSGANSDRKRCWDYCFTELLLYHNAKKKGVSEILAKPRFVGTVHDHPIYIQEKAETYSSVGGSILGNSEHSISETRTLCSSKNYKTFNLDWITDVYNYYGEKQFDKIMNFISDIGDLHDDNIGYIKSRPVILDYSDFMT